MTRYLANKADKTVMLTHAFCSMNLVQKIYNTLCKYSSHNWHPITCLQQGATTGLVHTSLKITQLNASWRCVRKSVILCTASTPFVTSFSLVRTLAVFGSGGTLVPFVGSMPQNYGSCKGIDIKLRFLWDFKVPTPLPPIIVYSGPSNLHIVPLSTSSTSLSTVRLPMGTKSILVMNELAQSEGLHSCSNIFMGSTYTCAKMVATWQPKGGVWALRMDQLEIQKLKICSGICLEHHTTHTCYC